MLHLWYLIFWTLALGKELEIVASLVLHFLAVCWSSATSVVSWLVTLLYFKFFAALNLTLEFVRSPHFEHFEHFGHLAQHLFQCHALSIDFLRVCCTWPVQTSQGLWLPCHFLWYMAGSNLSRTLVSSSLSSVPCEKFNAPIPNNDGQSHLAYF